jgi:hypothetical protein
LVAGRVAGSKCRDEGICAADARPIRYFLIGIIPANFSIFYVDNADLWIAANSFARKGGGFSSTESGQNYSQPKVDKDAPDKKCVVVSGQVSECNKEQQFLLFFISFACCDTSAKT